MEPAIKISQGISDTECYESLSKQLTGLFTKEDRDITNLANLAGVLKQSFDKISWVGIYFFDGDKLYLGPFQGKIACTSIDLGKGVCGKAARDKETVIVQDVNKFPGHIACDAESRSEIVVPFLRNDNSLYGVLDLDSAEYNSFNETDKIYLENICNFLAKEILKD